MYIYLSKRPVLYNFLYNFVSLRSADDVFPASLRYFIFFALHSPGLLGAGSVIRIFPDKLYSKSCHCHTLLLTQQIMKQITTVNVGEHFLPNDGPSDVTFRDMQRLISSPLIKKIAYETKAFSKKMKSFNTSGLQ